MKSLKETLFLTHCIPWAKKMKVLVFLTFRNFWILIALYVVFSWLHKTEAIRNGLTYFFKASFYHETNFSCLEIYTRFKKCLP